jgi:hypothetical protein
MWRSWHVDGNGVLEGTWQPDRRLAKPQFSATALVDTNSAWGFSHGVALQAKRPRRCYRNDIGSSTSGTGPSHAFPGGVFGRLACG